MENYQILLCILFGVCVAAVVYLIYKVSQSIRNKNQFSVLLLVSLLLGLSACATDDNAIYGSDDPGTSQPQEPDYASVATDLPVFVSASIDSEVSSALNTFLTNIVPIDEAEVAIVKDGDIGTYEGKLLDLYNRGGLIVVAQPQTTRYQEFAAKYDLPNVLPLGASQDVLLYVTNNNHEHYVLYAADGFDGETYYKSRIYDMFRWLKDVRSQKAKTRASTQFVTQFNPTVLVTKCESITHNYSMSLRNKVLDIKGASADSLNTNGSIDVTYTIYAAYMFEASKQPGDYYIVEREVTAHNADIWKPYVSKHAAYRSEIGGYFMTGLEVNSSLVDATVFTVTENDTPDKVTKKRGIMADMLRELAQTRKVNSQLCIPDIGFCSTPQPETSIGATTYTSGYNVSLSGSLSVGKSLGSLGFSAGYNSSQSRSVKDISIELVTDATSRSVTHNYKVNNIGKGWMYETIEAQTKKVPAVARTDFAASSAWCWKIPTAANVVYDSATRSFQLLTFIDFKYGCFAHTTGLEIYDGTRHYEYGLWSISEVTPPGRDPFGVLAMKNSLEDPIGNIRIYLTNNTEGRDTVQLSNSYMSTEIAKCALLEGSYTLEYDHLDKSDNHRIAQYRIDGIDIIKGADEESSTKEISTANGKFVKEYPKEQ